MKRTSRYDPELTCSDQTGRSPLDSPHFRVLRTHPLSSSSFLHSAQSSFSSFQPVGHIAHSNEFLLPYRCHICNKGYRSHFGLYHHKQHVHEQKTFPCPICQSKFTQKGKVKRHLNTVHKVAVCTTCCSILKLGADYNQHVLYCCK